MEWKNYILLYYQFYQSHYHFSVDSLGSHENYGIFELFNQSFNTNIHEMQLSPTRYPFIPTPIFPKSTSIPVPPRSAPSSGPSSPIWGQLTNDDLKLKFGMAWLNLTFAPKLLMSNKRKTILRHISGQINFGTLTGLMGPSGCGMISFLMEFFMHWFYF